MLFINPWHACAMRVIVLGLSFHPSVHPVFYHIFCHYTQQEQYQWVQYHIGFEMRICVQKLVRKNKRTSHYAYEHGFYLNRILPISSTVEGVEVIQRASMLSWFAKNATYQHSYSPCVHCLQEAGSCIFVLHSISRVHACPCNQ